MSETQKHTPTPRRIHMAGLFGGMGKRKTWCGRSVDDSQLPIIGTSRKVNCIACARSKQAHRHAQSWDYSYARRWGRVIRAALSKAGE
jgi:hypothetical protein